MPERGDRGRWRGKNWVVPERGDRALVRVVNAPRCCNLPLFLIGFVRSPVTPQAQEAVWECHGCGEVGLAEHFDPLTAYMNRVLGLHDRREDL